MGSVSDRRYSPDDDDDGEEEYPLRERLHGETAEFMEFEEYGGEGGEEVQEVVVLGEGRTPAINRPEVSAPRKKGFPQPSEACWSGYAPEECTVGEEVDGLLCPICYHGWSDGGDHAICCLPCGHIFGMSCIKRWLQQQKKSGKCPKCNVGCTVKGIRRLYASQLVTVEEESQKRIRDLEAKCAVLQEKDFENEVKWDRAVNACMSRQAELENKIDALEEKTSNLESLFNDATSHPSGLFASCSTCNKQPNDGPSCQFELQAEVQFDGSRLFDINSSSQIIMVARRLPGMGIRDSLTKTSLVNPHEAEDIALPSGTKAVKDLHISPFDGKSVLYASLGKTLSILSIESNNVVLGYKLPVGAWSCSWDVNSPHYIYAGLQNGMLMTFDVRQTQKPLEAHDGLTCNPVHTTCSVMQKRPGGMSTILTASSIGVCEWIIGSAQGSPSLVPESASCGVCISLSYSPSSSNIVASYRPKVEMSGGVSLSQISATPSSLGGPVVRGQHVCLRRIGSSYLKLSSASADMSDVRLPRSVIMDLKNGKEIFASCDEETNNLVLQEMSTLSTSGRMKLREPPLRDIRYSTAWNQGHLGCLSNNTLQLFRAELG